MPNTRVLQKLHFISTLWFALCVIVIVALSLYQAGYRWYVILSLSGYSIGLLYPAIAFYILAIFKGAQRAEEPEIEHPLTNTAIYNTFYSLCPLLGILAGLCSYQPGGSKSEWLLNLSFATLIVTFVVWIFLDPLVSLLENHVPSARRHRQERQESERIEREREELERQQLLRELKEQEAAEQQQLQIFLAPYARQLAGLLANRVHFEDESVMMDAGEIGLAAWRKGGMEGMKILRQSALALCPGPDCQDGLSRTDMVSIWWDGIGDWKHTPLSICSCSALS